jgi:hypothetical protein
MLGPWQCSRRWSWTKCARHFFHTLCSRFFFLKHCRWKKCARLEHSLKCLFGVTAEQYNTTKPSHGASVSLERPAPSSHSLPPMLLTYCPKQQDMVAVDLSVDMNELCMITCQLFAHFRIRSWFARPGKAVAKLAERPHSTAPFGDLPMPMLCWPWSITQKIFARHYLRSARCIQLSGWNRSGDEYCIELSQLIQHTSLYLKKIHFYATFSI